MTEMVHPYLVDWQHIIVRADLRGKQLLFWKFGNLEYQNAGCAGSVKLWMSRCWS